MSLSESPPPIETRDKIETVFAPGLARRNDESIQGAPMTKHIITNAESVHVRASAASA